MPQDEDRLMRLLLLNPNTSEAATASMAAVARAAAGPATDIVAVSAPRGAAYILDRSLDAVASEVVLEVLAERRGSYDGAILAAFTDPGLAGARAACAVPVVGIAEAALLFARGLGRRISVVTVAPGLVALMRERVDDYGLGDRIVSIRSCPSDLLGRDGPGLEAMLGDAAEAAIAEDGAEVIVVGGGPIADMRRGLRARLGVPVVDGVTCAVRLAETLVGLA
jgi:Asp/Glu/hydantoin racemase